MTTRRTIGYLALVNLLLTALWLALLIGEAAVESPVSFEQALDQARQAGLGRLIGYGNAALITLTVTLLFTAIYARYRQAAPLLGLIGLVFVPIYASLNLAVYLLQIIAVPMLLAQIEAPGALIALRLLLQSWPGSSAAFFNNLAYALLGIPSILYGGLLWREGGLLRLSGVLLALSGIACILGVIGSLLGQPALGAGALVGGALFLLALAPLSWEMLQP